MPGQGQVDISRPVPERFPYVDVLPNFKLIGSRLSPYATMVSYRTVSSVDEVRDIPVVDRSILAERQRVRDDKSVVPLGEPVTPWAYTKHFGYVVKGTDFAGVTVQALRHSHASQLIAGDVNIKTISERLGHSAITITLDTYGHMLPGMDEQAAKITDLILKAREDK